MILDERTEFADAAACTGANGTIVNVGDVVDTQVPGSLNLLTNQNDNSEIFLVITVATDVITAGAAGTLFFRLVSDASNPPLVNDTATVHYQSRAFVVDDLVALQALPAHTTLLTVASQLAVPPVQAQAPVLACVVVQVPNDLNYERFMGVQAVIGATTVTAGTVNAFLTHDAARWKPYADAVN